MSAWRGVASEPGRSPSARATVGRALRFTFWSVVLWTGLGLFFASQLVLAGLSWPLALSFSMPRWYSWGLLAPAIVWTDGRIVKGRSMAARVAVHVPLGIAWTLLAIALRLVSRPLRGSPWPPNLAAFVLERFSWDLLVYAAIVGVAIARDYASRARDQERHAHGLALQASDLERKLIEARLQALRAQIQPHFLFNALNTISAFTETDPPTARRLMDQLGGLLRASLTHASGALVSLGQELTFLDDYLAIESARFEGRLTVDVRADDAALEVRVPGFLLQPLVENAIRHGVAPRVSGGRVEVAATRSGAWVELRVSDNGMGLPAGWTFEANAGVGLRNVASRLEHLYGRSDLLRVSARPVGGTEVNVRVPAAPDAPRPAAIARDAVGAGV